MEHSETRQKALKRFTEGICFFCSAPRLKTAKVCLKHAVYLIVRRYDIKEKVKLTNLLVEKLKEQEFKCYYTGVPIYPTINATVDHLTPKNKNGSDDISNLVWCEASINRLKCDYTEQEFRTLYSQHILEFQTLHSLQHNKLDYMLGTN